MNKDNSITLGVFLKRYRAEMQYSGRLLSEKIGVSKHLFEKWENANYKPNASDSEKIKKFFGLKSLNALNEKTLQTCIAGINPHYVEIIKEKNSIIHDKQKRIKDLEQMVTLLNEKVLVLESKIKNTKR